MFSSLCQQMFGQPVPLYHDPGEDYCPDEPSLMAVRYLVWSAACEMDDIWWHVDNPELERLARMGYELLDEAFEEAPINERLATDIDKGDPIHCLQFTFGFTPCIAAPDNPLYDDYIAHNEAIEMLWNDESIGTGAMLWLLERHYLPDLFVTEFFPYCYTLEEKKADTRFLLRFMRRERY